MLAFLIGAAEGAQAAEGVFTGDTLFKGTVGGTLAPGHATFADLIFVCLKLRFDQGDDGLSCGRPHQLRDFAQDERE